MLNKESIIILDKAYFDEKMAELNFTLDVLAHGGKKTVNIKDVARLEGVSPSYLYSTGLYLLPNYGISQYPGPKRWDVEVYLKWRKTSLDERMKNMSNVLKNM